MNATATILVATDCVRDAEVVTRLLAEEYANVLHASDPDRLAKDFDQHKPDVLILAYEDLALSEHSYFGVLKFSATARAAPHRTVVFCTKDNVDSAYELCRKEYFDEYVVFWPLAFDTWRLAMTINNAMRELRDATSQSMAEAMSCAKKIGGLDTVLQGKVQEAADHPERVSESIDRAQHDIDAAIDRFSNNLERNDQNVIVKDSARFRAAIDELKGTDVRQAMQTARESIAPMRNWAGDLTEKMAPYVDSLQTLTSITKRATRVALVADDDVLQCRLISQILQAEGMEVLIATSGYRALVLSQRNQPDLFMLDFNMPDIDGIEVARQIRTMPQFADTPIVIVTGRSERGIVLKGREAGVTDFIVKPFTKELFLLKTEKLL